jgi:hypothetical protein
VPAPQVAGEGAKRAVSNWQLAISSCVLAAFIDLILKTLQEAQGKTQARAPAVHCQIDNKQSPEQ